MGRCRFKYETCKICFFANRLENLYLIACKTIKFNEFLEIQFFIKENYFILEPIFQSSKNYLKCSEMIKNKRIKVKKIIHSCINI